MKEEFVQCASCKAKIPMERCEFATYRTVVEGKEYVFCCAQCAQQFQAKKKQKKQ